MLSLNKLKYISIEFEKDKRIRLDIEKGIDEIEQYLIKKKYIKKSRKFPHISNNTNTYSEYGIIIKTFKHSQGYINDRIEIVIDKNNFKGNVDFIFDTKYIDYSTKSESITNDQSVGYKELINLCLTLYTKQEGYDKENRYIIDYFDNLEDMFIKLPKYKDRFDAAYSIYSFDYYGIDMILEEYD